MKTSTEAYKAKLLSRDSKVRLAAINQLATSGNRREVEFLIATIFKNRPPNGVATLLKAIGDSGNQHGIQPLIENYGPASHTERRLIMERLLKSGVFSAFFPGEQPAKSIGDRLWSLLFGLNSDQLRRVLSLSPEKFEEQLELAWRSTKHWRK